MSAGDDLSDSFSKFVANNQAFLKRGSKRSKTPFANTSRFETQVNPLSLPEED